MDKKNKFKSLQFIRVLAFLNIFLLHSKCFRVTNFNENAAWAVSFFIMISGFLYGYRYYKDSNLKISSTIKFTVTKLIKIYPLYILSTLLMLPFSELFRIGRGESIRFIIRKIFYNVFLLQSFSFDKKIAYAFTGVGWYLSTFMFLLFLTIPIIVLLKKIIKKKSHIIIMLLIAILSSYVLVDLLSTYQIESYFTYVFPPTRLLEYICALLFGFLLSEYDYNQPVTARKKVIYTLLEITIIIGILVLFRYCYLWAYFNLSVLWIIPNMILISIFSKEYGLISKLFSNRFFVHLGDLTFDTYLIHEVIIMYVYIIPSINDGIRSFEKIGLWIFCLVMSFLLAEFLQKNNSYEKIGEKIKEKI